MKSRNKNCITASQIRAARGLLDWSQENLAGDSGLSIATIRKIESGHISPRESTIGTLITSLENAGIEFTYSGLRLSESDIIMIEGNDAYLQLLDDIYLTMQDNKGEVLFLYADSAAATEAEIESTIKIKKMGIRWRFLSEEGNTYLHYPLEEYRWIPKKFFKRNLQLIYANKIAMGCKTNTSKTTTTKIALIQSAPLAESNRNLFNFMWDNCRKPSHSTAPKIYD